MSGRSCWKDSIVIPQESLGPHVHYSSVNRTSSFTRFSFLVPLTKFRLKHLSSSTASYFTFSCRVGRRRKGKLLASEGKCKNPVANYQYFILNISEVLQCRHKLIRWMASPLPVPSPLLSDSLSLLHFVLSLEEKGAHFLSPCAPCSTHRPPLSHPHQVPTLSSRHGELVPDPRLQILNNFWCWRA